jgi:hypothetical protein
MARIEYAGNQPPSFLARWASRLALFSAVLLIMTVFLHRVFALPTPVAINIAVAAFAGAVLVVLMATVAGLDIWVTGRQGAARVIFGATLGLALLTIPAGLFMVSQNWPVMNDVSTDTEHPPEFREIATIRARDANPVKYAGEKFKALQQASYPDIKTLVLPRSSEETFDLVIQALGKLKLKILAEIPPGTDTPDAPGMIEIADRTLIMGFRDDIAIRVAGDDKASRVDVRSSSRYGQSDFGRNADRIRQILREVVGRYEASVPNGARSARALAARAGDKKNLKRPLVHGPGSTADRLRQGLSRSGARHEPGQKGQPPAKDEGKAPGKSRARPDE